MKLLRTALGWLVFSGIVFGGLELALRAMPEVVPLSLLKRFHPQPRLAIARMRSLWNESQMQELPRDDGGPALLLFKPGSSIHYDFHARGEKGTVVMDDQGFCNPVRDSYGKPNIDIISIGDSFTWCVLVAPDQTWTSRLGQLGDYSVYNLARPGIGPYAYLQILKKYGLRKQPDMVLMNFYEGNDLRDAVRYQEHVAAARQGKVLYASAGDRNDDREIDIEWLLGNGVLRNSYALNFVLALADRLIETVRKTLRRFLSRNALPPVDFHYRLEFPEKTVDFNIQNADQSEVRVAWRLKHGDIDFSSLDAALDEFATLAECRGFRPVLLYSPSAYTAYAEFVRFADPELTRLMP